MPVPRIPTVGRSLARCSLLPRCPAVPKDAASSLLEAAEDWGRGEEEGKGGEGWEGEGRMHVMPGIPTHVHFILGPTAI